MKRSKFITKILGKAKFIIPTDIILEQIWYSKVIAWNLRNQTKVVQDIHSKEAKSKSIGSHYSLDKFRSRAIFHKYTNFIHKQGIKHGGITSLFSKRIEIPE